MAEKIFDNKKSMLRKNEIHQFKVDSPKIVNSPVVSDKTTLEVASLGATGIVTDKYVLVEDRLDV